MGSHTRHTSHTQPSGRRGAAIWYRVRADLRGRRGQAGSVLLVVVLATWLIGLGLVIVGSVSAPFDRLFTQLNGAHLWLYSSPLTPGQVVHPVANIPLIPSEITPT